MQFQHLAMFDSQLDLSSRGNGRNEKPSQHGKATCGQPDLDATSRAGSTRKDCFRWRDEHRAGPKYYTNEGIGRQGHELTLNLVRYAKHRLVICLTGRCSSMGTVLLSSDRLTGCCIRDTSRRFDISPISESSTHSRKALNLSLQLLPDEFVLYCLRAHTRTASR